MKLRYLIAGAYGFAGAALAAKLLSRKRDVAWDEHAAELHHAEKSRFAEIDGVRVHYQEAGEENAPPVVLIHGFCASNFVWSDVLVPLADAGFRIIAPDLVGFGFSEKPRRVEYTIAAQSRMITRLLDHLGIERAAIVGSSYGGAVAAMAALDYPDRVERLALVGAVINDDIKKEMLMRMAASPLVGDLLSPLLLDSRRMVRWRMKNVYAECASPHLHDEKRLEAHHRPLRAARTQRAVLRTLRQWNAERIAREAHLIKQPTLLVWGENDLDVPLRDGEHLFDSIPHARFIVFRRCGHLPMEEYPREFAEVIKNFVGAETVSVAPPRATDDADILNKEKVVAARL
ncbi:MAG: alpha/beta fold hydrolase [Pyrinomonadaceae bacterium]